MGECPKKPKYRVTVSKQQVFPSKLKNLAFLNTDETANHLDF